MKIKEYIKDTTNPFIDTTATHDDSFFYSEDFQSMLTEHMKVRHGRKEIAESIIEDSEDEEVDVSVIVREICEDVYNSNKYRYNTLWNTMHLDYNPIENYDRTETEINNIFIGEQKFTHKQGEQTVDNAYGSRLNINTKGEMETVNDYDKIHKGLVKGEQANTNEYGSKLDINTIGEQTTDNEYDKVHKDVTKGEQQNLNQYDKVSKTITKGEQANTNEYGSQLEINVNGEQNSSDVNGSRLQNTVYGEQVKDLYYDDQRQANEQSATLGISPYDDASEYGNTGIITDERGWWVLDPDRTENGDGAFVPKERTYTDNTQNIDEHTDKETTKEHIDSVENVGYTDVHKKDAYSDSKEVVSHTDNLTEGERVDTEITNTRGDITIEGNRVDSEETLKRNDSVKVGQRIDSSEHIGYTDNLTEGSRSDSEDVDARTDKVKEGKRIDTSEQVGYNDSIKNGERSDEDNHGGRNDNNERHYYAHGNIGIRSNQELIKQERDIANLNILEIISRDIVSQIACTVLAG